MNAGEQIGKYRLERELGAGGMGTVWLAHDTELDRKVALKVLRPALAGDDTAQARLLREARAMAKLRHPNVITVFDAETIAGRDLVAMELVDGENMAGWLAGDRSEDDIIGTVLAAGRGLAAAHAAGMVHRDFKPANVLVEKGGRVLVTDFGLARADARSDALAETAAEPPKLAAAPVAPLPLALEETAASQPRSVALDETAASEPGKRVDVTATHPRTTSGSKGSLDSDLTRTGTLLGTPAYMAPEQIRGTAADARADQFAFCVTAWEALAGKRPFPGDDVGAIAKAIERGEPVHADKVPRRLRPLLQRGLASDPARRWPSMEPLLDAIHRAWQGPKKQKQWAQAIGIGVVMFFVILIGANLLGSKDHEAAAPADTCNGSAALATVWSPAVRSKLAEQLGSEGTRSLRALDRWAATWTQIYDANCKAPNDSDFALRKICLETGRDSMTLLVKPGDADAVKAVAEADLPLVLPAPEACQKAPRVISPPLPKDPEVRRKVEHLRSLLLVMRTRIMDRQSAERDALLTRANAAIAEAEGTGDLQLKSEALGLRALVLAFATHSRDISDRTAKLAEAYQALREAGEAAEASGNDRVRVMLLIGQLEMASGVPGYWSDIDDLIRRAELGVQHVQDPVAQLLFDELRGVVAMNHGQWTDAIERMEKTRHGWLERGSDEMYSRFTGLEAETLLQRHADGDLVHGLDILKEADSHDLRLSSHQFLAVVRAEITGSLGTASPLENRMLGVVDSAGTGDASLTVEITGLSAGTTHDDGPVRVMRRAMPDVLVQGTNGNWRPSASKDGTFTLSGLAKGRYDVLVYISTAGGDTQVVRQHVTVAGATRVTVDVPAARELVPTFGPTDGRALWGVALSLPRAAHPATAGALRTLVAAAPWWSVAWVHTERSGTAVDLTAELGALGPTSMVCSVAGATYSPSLPSDLALGSDSAPVHCTD